ncbi:MAG: hypothetical protein AAGF04_05545 [Chlamydiota bacterium]
MKKKQSPSLGIFFWVFSTLLFLPGPCLFAKTSVSNAQIARLAQELGNNPTRPLVESLESDWLRDPKLERFDILPLPEETRAIILNWAKNNGCYYAIEPQREYYDTVLIFGARSSVMAMRLRFLEKLFLQGLRTKKLVWLTGKRPLRETEKRTTPGCTTEEQAARYLWDTHLFSEELRSIPIKFIVADMQWENDSWKRPSTRDTVNAWKNQTDPGSCLFISNQPFCAYQEATVANLLEEYSFEVVGPKFHSHYYQAPGAVILDTLARLLHERSLCNAQAAACVY